MIAIVYRFPLPKDKLQKFLKIDKTAETIYKKQGLKVALESPYLIRDIDPKTYEILMLSHYNMSLKAYHKKSQAIDKDPQILNLYNRMLKFVPENKIKTYEYQCIK